MRIFLLTLGFVVSLGLLYAGQAQCFFGCPPAPCENNNWCPPGCMCADGQCTPR